MYIIYAKFYSDHNRGSKHMWYTDEAKKSIRFLVIGRLQNRCGDALVSPLFIYMYTWLLEPDQMSHVPSMVAKRGLTNQANIHTPM